MNTTIQEKLERKVAEYDQKKAAEEKAAAKLAEAKEALRTVMVDILSNQTLQEYCKRFGNIAILPVYQGAEGEIGLLRIGYADNKYSRKDYGEDVGREISFFTKVGFGSLNLNSIISMGEGIGKHTQDFEGSMEMINACLDNGVDYHLPLKQLTEKHQKCDETLEKLAKGGVLNPEEVAVLGENNHYWANEKIALTPAYLTQKVEAALEKIA